MFLEAVLLATTVSQAWKTLDVWKDLFVQNLRGLLMTFKLAFGFAFMLFSCTEVPVVFLSKFQSFVFPFFNKIMT